MKVAVLLLICLSIAAATATLRPHHRPHHHHHHRNAGEHGGGHGGHSKSKGHDSHHWGYTKNGAEWEGKCSAGERQSPIDISTFDLVQSHRADTKYKMEFHYKAATGLKMLNNGHTIIVNAKDFNLGYVHTLGARWNALQFHFHAPSEHTIDDQSYGVELHIVHQKEGAKGLEDLLVVGVFFDPDAGSRKKSSFLKSLKWKNLPKENGQSTEITNAVDLNDLNKALASPFYAYHGSLTTPACDETVNWRVFSRVLSMSSKQLKSIQDLFANNMKFASGNGNNREIQPTNNRVVRVIRNK